MLIHETLPKKNSNYRFAVDLVIFSLFVLLSALSFIS